MNKNVEMITTEELKGLIQDRIMLNNLKIEGAKDTEMWKRAEKMAKEDFKEWLKHYFKEEE